MIAVILKCYLTCCCLIGSTLAFYLDGARETAHFPISYKSKLRLGNKPWNTDRRYGTRMSDRKKDSIQTKGDEENKEEK